MDQFDDFITYEDPYVKPSNLFENDYSMSPSFSDDHSDSTGVLPNYIPKTVHNFIDADDYSSPNCPSTLSQQVLNQNMYNYQGYNAAYNKSSPCESSEQTDLPDQYELYDNSEENESKLQSRSKRIQKREKAKDRATRKGKEDPTEVLLQKADAKFIPENFDDPDLDDKTKKKMVQMIRNRVSAQNSRDRKKVYLQQLEEAQELLASEKNALIREKNNLLKKVDEIEASYAKLLKENEELKKNAQCHRCGTPYQPQAYSPNEREAPRLFPSRAHAGGGSIFGMGLSFALMLCLFIVMNTGDSYGGKKNKMTMMNAISKFTNYPQVNGLCAKAEEMSQPQQMNIEGIEEKIFAACEDNQPAKAALDALYDKIYETYEATNEIITSLTTGEPANEKMVEELKSDENIVEATTQLQVQNNVCSNSFELYKKISSNDMHEDQINKNRLEKTNILDLEHTNYVQLMVPKSAISRFELNSKLGSMDCSSMDKMREEDNNRLVEVWAKIFAVGDLALSL